MHPRFPRTRAARPSQVAAAFATAFTALMGGLLVLVLAACAGTPGTSARADDAVDLRLMSFNIRTSSAEDGANAWPRRRELVSQTVTSRAPDIAGFQEVQPDQLAFLREQLTGYGDLARSRETDAGRGESVPLFYALRYWALDETEHGTFWLSDTPEVPGSRTWENYFPRIVTWGRLVHRDTGRGLYVYNAHFDHESDLARLNSATLLRQRIRDRRHADPVVVFGDFNAEPGSAVLQTLLGGEPPFADTLVAAGKAGCADGTFHAFDGERDGRRIDFILVSPGVAVSDAAIVHDEANGRFPSDHFPVEARVRLP